MFAAWTALAFLGGAYYWLFLQLGSHPSTSELQGIIQSWDTYPELPY